MRFACGFPAASVDSGALTASVLRFAAATLARSSCCPYKELLNAADVAFRFVATESRRRPAARGYASGVLHDEARRSTGCWAAHERR